MSPRLKDYGKEIFRLERQLGPTELSEWVEKQVSIRDTGVVMEKRTCLFRPSRFHPEGLRETWPWKVLCRLKSKDDIQAYCRKLMDEGWELKRGKRRLDGRVNHTPQANGGKGGHDPAA